MILPREAGKPYGIPVNYPQSVLHFPTNPIFSASYFKSATRLAGGFQSAQLISGAYVDPIVPRIAQEHRDSGDRAANIDASRSPRSYYNGPNRSRRLCTGARPIFLPILPQRELPLSCRRSAEISPLSLIQYPLAESFPISRMTNNSGSAPSGPICPVDFDAGRIAAGREGPRGGA